jgi:voltage-gated potassium channel
LETVEWIRQDYAPLLDTIEWVSNLVFGVEYVARVWTSVDRSSGEFRDPLWGRLRYMIRPSSLIDLIAVLPAFLGIIGYDLRLLRLVRLLRMLKLTRYSTTVGLLWDVFREEARAILAVLSLLIMAIVIGGCIMYILESERQPVAFGSIPAAMWWALETVTTVGYGDVVPVTPLGKVLGGVVAISGIGGVALFSGILTVSFMEQLRLRRDRYRRLITRRVKDRRLTRSDLVEIERMAQDLGVGVEQAREIAHAALAGQRAGNSRDGLGWDDHGREGGFCPHCGQPVGVETHPRAVAPQGNVREELKLNT